MSLKIVAIACDHAGLAMKLILKSELEEAGHSVIDLGTNNTDPVDYPDFGFAVAKALGEGKVNVGVLVCGSGVGISIAANRHLEVRAALVHDTHSARMARLHNNANVICFGGRVIGEEVARDCLNIFLKTKFEGGRHARRVDKLKHPQW
jgi:ribose 5-phosphate isomerase B